MKKMKKGFTLAEVLITLAIIGVVAAVTMPNLITSGQYNALGTKLSKFQSTVESAAMAYVQSGEALSPDTPADAAAFANSSFLVKGYYTKPATANGKYTDNSSTKKANAGFTTPESAKVNVNNAITTGAYGMVPAQKNTDVAMLKDDTYVIVDTADGTAPDGLDTQKMGVPAVVLTFNPNMSGLPKDAKKEYMFYVTELGYVLPVPGDACTQTLANKNYKVKASEFTSDTNCYASSSK